MKKNISSFMTVLSCSLLMASCSNADNSLKNDENKQSSINVDANTIQKPSAQKSSFDVKVGLMSSSTGNAPLIFIDEKGGIQGFEYDILKEIDERSDYNFQYEYQPRDDLFNGMNDKEIDMIAGIEISKERTQKYNMTNSYLDVYPITLLSKNPKIKKLEDIDKNSTAVKEDSMQTTFTIVKDYENNHDNTNIDYTVSDWISVQALLRDDVKIAIGNSVAMPYFYSKYSTKKDPLYFSIDYDYPQQSYGFLINKENVDMMNDMNKHILDMKSDGTYQKIFKKWF
ncbi:MULTISPECIES: ABC transporter substrate-binding protein [Moraxella]|jgi:bacterial extracellular solute-binding fmaily protein|uniref:Solute-binding protein family 3/N-terminal domain-containing protein n=3 Tax=Moraxella TaxID=475 RepID=A0A1B8Q5I6_MORLA|nr:MULTISPECIES: transporter substrate-binding domain-containing protein [Moraxella]MBE9587124.1 amino acid ABC transporter substrate-binding protein [Moraxella sp. K1630]MBE9577618.1 amino acid ABC transporter substrate-binding protein [Moraxella sp. K1664]MBE9590381.1 amino acid ABC transporter substrate-binding protein [Moraxella sp. K127]MBE9595362.1 amino acid ABC transporter substrate-binding protein [Moraxella sp. K2450]MDH9217667.1 transporter substrate-binding domain-containing protei